MCIAGPPAEKGWFFTQGRYKAQVVEQVLRMGYNLLFSDIDAIFLRNPLPYLDQARRPGAAMCGREGEGRSRVPLAIEAWR